MSARSGISKRNFLVLSKMVLHIIGAGPTGIAIAWNKVRTNEEVHIWEKRDLPGGSWWTADFSQFADRHAPRLLFPSSQPNWTGLLMDMNLEYTKYYEPNDGVISSFIKAVVKSFKFVDYIVIVGMILQVGINSAWAKRTSVRDAVKGPLSTSAEEMVSTLTVGIDGVQWDRMTMWELFESINRTVTTAPWTEKVQGRYLGHDIYHRLREAGVHLHMNKKLERVSMPRAYFSKGDSITLNAPEDRIVLCLDAAASIPYLRLYWEPGVADGLSQHIYGCRSFLFQYSNRFEIPPAPETLQKSGNAFIIDWVPGKDTTVLYVGDYNNSWKSVEHVVETLGIPEPDSWRECEDTADMSSAIWSLNGVPTQSKHPQLHMVGMMSPRDTPYASVEAAVEVGLRWCGGRPREPFKGTTLAFMMAIFSLLLIIYNDETRLKVASI